jgi:hypothetical protein
MFRPTLVIIRCLKLFVETAVLPFCDSNIGCVVLMYLLVLVVSSCCVVCLDNVDTFVDMEAIDLHVWVNNYLIHVCLRMKVSK